MDEALPAPPVFLDGLWNEDQVLGGRLIVRKPKTFNREEQAKSIVAAFHAIGGDARLAHWANEHPGYFFTKLFPKILPQPSAVQVNAGSLNVIYQAAIPPSKLDEPPPPPIEAQYEDVQPNGTESGGTTPSPSRDSNPRPAWDAEPDAAGDDPSAPDPDGGGA
jgi:hypothetical protein